MATDADEEFVPGAETEDDLETFDREVEMTQFSHEEHVREVNQLEAESELPLHILLRAYGIEPTQPPKELEIRRSSVQFRNRTETTHASSDCASVSTQESTKSSTLILAESLAIETRLLESCGNSQGGVIQPTKPLPCFPEPKPNKTHWFHALEEMSWLAGDFIRERKWRARTALKFATTVVKSRRNLAAIVQKRNISENAVLQKTARNIAHAVMLFWFKVEKVQMLKHQVADAHVEKCKLDAQLDKLVEVTEAYSSRLAKRLRYCADQEDGDGSEESISHNDVENSIENSKDLGKTKGVDLTTSNSRLNRSSNEVEGISGLLKHSLRDYQLDGVKWMKSCYSNNLNVLLADEMGLGKTIQTISLLSSLATEFGNWGPHLIVVPTSVMLNWEVEFKKWCPGLKVFTYYGTVKERRIKRHGWSKPNSFHVCITSYRIVTQDHSIFRRKNWQYLILDEAHMIKNWRSQRWQTLLNFSTKHRLLITGTPLQNELMELWALMHFLMPDLFSSHSEFKDWFASPLTAMVDGSQSINQSLVSRLHSILRPFILRRLKSEVEKTLPCKFEHVIKCQLSKRQRRLYEEYISANSTLQTLSSGNVMGVMNCLMQLRKVCNHPDLFAGRHIFSSYDMCHVSWLRLDSIDSIAFQNRRLSSNELYQNSQGDDQHMSCTQCLRTIDETATSISSTSTRTVLRHFTKERYCVCGGTFQRLSKQDCQRPRQIDRIHSSNWLREFFMTNTSSNYVSEQIQSTLADMCTAMLQFTFIIPRARTSTPATRNLVYGDLKISQLSDKAMKVIRPIRPIIIRRTMFFPDRRLVQFDCGKLQALAVLLRNLKIEGHKVLIFTQMTKMLDILEAFLNLHGYTYCRLDGSTSTEQRQLLMQRFNSDKKIFAFILSTRSGGFGINLTGADTVVFYDSDWNPAMDQQAQDRCHRIGQTRQVHIYRLISQGTIEESILEKAIQKRELDNVAIQLGNFNTEAFAQSELVGSVRKHEECPDTALECETKSDTPGQRSAEQSMLRLNDDDLNSLLPIEKYALKYFSM